MSQSPPNAKSLTSCCSVAEYKHALNSHWGGPPNASDVVIWAQSDSWINNLLSGGGLLECFGPSSLTSEHQRCSIVEKTKHIYTYGRPEQGCCCDHVCTFTLQTSHLWPYMRTDTSSSSPIHTFYTFRCKCTLCGCYTMNLDKHIHKLNLNRTKMSPTVDQPSTVDVVCWSSYPIQNQGVYPRPSLFRLSQQVFKVIIVITVDAHQKWHFKWIFF